MIANCPSCGTHYKHEPPKVRVRARCGQCDASLELGRLRPYRIVSAAAPTAEQASCAASHLPIGLDHPALATTIAKNVARSNAREVARPVPLPIRAPEIWDNEDPLPEIPERMLRDADESAVPHVLDNPVSPEDEDGGVSEAPSGGATTFALWLTTGAIVGTGASWTMGGTTITGIAAGAAFGSIVGWGWLRWTSPK